MKAIKKPILPILAALFLCSLLVVFLPAVPSEAASHTFTVMLNPGHGPASSGSGAVASGTKESKLNEEITAKVVSALKKKGINVVVTNKMSGVSNDAPYLLNEKTQGTNDSGRPNGQYHFANQLLPAIHNPASKNAGVQTPPDLLITIHNNWSSNGSINGYELYYSGTTGASPDYGKNADSVSRSKAFASLVDTQFKKSGFPMARRGIINYDNNSLTKYSAMPSLLVECGYMTNSADLSSLKTSSKQQVIADRLADAVVAYKAKYPQPVFGTGKATGSVAASSTAATKASMKATNVKSGMMGISKVEFVVKSASSGKTVTYNGTKSGTTWSATLNASKHDNAAGNYTITANAVTWSGTKEKLGSTSVTLESKNVTKAGSLSFNTSSINTGMAVARAKNVTGPNGITKVRFAVWNPSIGKTKTKKWYTAKLDSKGSWYAYVYAKDHGNKTGTYRMEAYAYDKDGNSTNLGKKDGKMNVDTKLGAASYSVTAKNTTATATVKGVKGGNGVKSVRFKVWSSGGSSDQVWIDGKKSGTTWTAKIDSAAFNTKSGKYTVRAYAYDLDGKRVRLFTKTVTLKSNMKAASLSFKESTNTIGMAVARAVKVKSADGVEKVRFAVWNPSIGKTKTKKWYTAKLDSSGRWYAYTYAKNHGNTTGRYKMEAFGYDKDGRRVSLGVQTVTIDLANSPATAASVTSNKSAYTSKSMTAYVNEVRAGTKQPATVRVKIWSDYQGQNDKKWYTATYDKANDRWKASVNLNEFNTAGKFWIQAYATNAAGKESSVGKHSVTVEAGALKGYFIMGNSGATVNQMANYMISELKSRGNPWDDKWYGMTAKEFAQAYYDYCQAEGVKAEVAFAQMLLETNYLAFGNLCIREQNNFAGLGATGGSVPVSDKNPTGQDRGIYFGNAKDGIKSQIQHLKAYASKAGLNLGMASEYNRFNLIPRGVAPTVESLSGKWAVSDGYGGKITTIINAIKSASNATVKALMEELPADVLEAEESLPDATLQPEPEATPEPAEQPQENALPEEPETTTEPSEQPQESTPPEEEEPAAEQGVSGGENAAASGEDAA